MITSSKHQKGSQKLKKDYTSNSAKPVKRLISSLSPTKVKDQKKTRFITPNTTTQHSSKMDTEENKDMAQLANHKDSISDTKLERALGPLVQQLKFL